MMPSLRGKTPVDDGFLGGGRSDLRVGLAIRIGGVVISAVLAAYAVVSAFGIGPPVEPVAYLFVAISVVMTLVTLLVTFVRSEVRAGLYLATFWALALASVFALLKYAG